MSTATMNQTSRARLQSQVKPLQPINQSVLATLRSLAPRRALRWSELERVAELQANRLLELAGIDAPAVPTDVIAGLPRIEVRTVIDLPVGGMADWVTGRWMLSIAAGDSEARQRYSIAHEFKHIIDHPARKLIYAGSPGITPEDQAERLAEYFAACL